LGFEVLLTVDKGVAYGTEFPGKTNFSGYLSREIDRLKDLKPHIPDCLAALATIRPGAVARIPFSDL